MLSMSWRSDLLTYGSLQQNAIDAAINKWTRRLTVCVHADKQHLNTCCGLLIRPEKNHEQIKWKWLDLFSKRWKRCSMYCWLCDFNVPKVSQGKVCTLNRWGKKVNPPSMAYSLSNICAKSYWNRTTTVKIITGGLMVSFLRHSAKMLARVPT